MEQTIKRASEIPADYVVLEENPNGTILVGPDTSWKGITSRLGIEPASDQEAEALLDQHRDQMLAPDDEG